MARVRTYESKGGKKRFEIYKQRDGQKSRKNNVHNISI